MGIFDFSIYLLSFVLLWLGAGLIIASIDGFSRHLKMSSFSISFFFLGILTSIPEFAVGFSAVAENDPEIFVGNLLGGVTVIFLFVIPVLAILGKGIKLTNHLHPKTLVFALLVMLAPAVTVLDRRVTNFEGVILIGLYIVLFLIIERQRGFLDRMSKSGMNIKSYSPLDILKLLLGVAIVLISSRFAVDKTLELSTVLRISPFVVSLVILSLGTNLPELSLAVRSIISGKRDVAMGDYLGSAAANTLLFGIFTLINTGEVLTTNNFYITFLFILTALGMFYHFTRKDRNISRNEGLIMILVYIVFVALELSV